MFRAGLFLLAMIAAIGLGDEMLMRRWSPAKGGDAAALASGAARSAADPDTLDDGEADSAGGLPPALAAAVAGSGGQAAEQARCSILQPPQPLPSDLPEASGAAPSLRTPGIVWVQNDSHGPEVFAVDEAGGQRGRVHVAGAQAIDWEDIAVAPCQGGSCLYVGDIGDNRAARRGITVYRVHEPSPRDPATLPAEAFAGVYPDGPHDAEAMFALPDGGVFVLTKGETGSAALYRFPRPLRAGPPARLEKLVEFAGERMKRRQRFTGAAASHDGRWVAVRTLRSVEFYRAADLVAGRTGTPLEFDLSGLREAQGEGIGFARGDTIVLSSEGGKKHAPGSISRIACALPR